MIKTLFAAYKLWGIHTSNLGQHQNKVFSMRYYFTKILMTYHHEYNIHLINDTLLV